MVRSELRNEDERLMKVVNDWLDKNVYSMPCFSKVYRNEDAGTQVLGIDTTFELNGERHWCDEKAAVRYIGKNLLTFSFELSFIDRSGSVRDGWLLSKDNINDTYLLVWIDRAESEHPKDYTELKKVEWALVKKESILNYLFWKGFNVEGLKSKNDAIRSGVDKRMHDIRADGYKFSYSTKLVEKPINVIIPRYELMRMSLMHG